MIEYREPFGFAILLVQFALAIPLVLSLFRSSVRSGYSLVGEAVWVVAGIGWLVYGLGVGSVPLMLSGGLAFVTSLAVTTLSWRDCPTQERKNSTFAAMAVLTGCGVPLAVWGNNGLSVALTAFGVLQFFPQIMKTARAWRPALKDGSSFGGVGVLGSSLRSLYSLSWAVYAGAWFLWGIGFGHIDWPLVAWGLTGCIAFGMNAVLAAQVKKHPLPGIRSCDHASPSGTARAQAVKAREKGTDAKSPES